MSEGEGEIIQVGLGAPDILDLLGMRGGRMGLDVPAFDGPGSGGVGTFDGPIGINPNDLLDALDAVQYAPRRPARTGERPERSPETTSERLEAYIERRKERTQARREALAAQRGG